MFYFDLSYNSQATLSQTQDNNSNELKKILCSNWIGHKSTVQILFQSQLIYTL